MNISWINPVTLVEQELVQLQEEGNDVARLREKWLACRQASSSDEVLRSSALALLDEMAPLTARAAGGQGSSPSTFPEIMAASDPPGRIAPVPSRKDLLDRIRGGWYGRAAGCLLGKPVEKIPREGIRELLAANGAWPLSAYITERGIPAALLKKYPWNRHGGKESLRENLRCMPEDDDMNYPMLNLSVLESFGASFTTEQIAETWLSRLPVLSTFTAERVAYLNCLEGFLPPATAVHRNPYREWIGAQIRGDIWGWVMPGDPAGAAALAYKDARLSHVRNGIYGEMFAAAMVSAASVLKSPREIVDIALHCIPGRSVLAEAVRFAAALPETERSWEGAVDRLSHRYGRYHWVHTVNNAALVTAALVFGEGDFGRSICNVVMGGWDTDSNGATVGSVVGTLLGARRLPRRWIAPLKNRIRSSLKGFDNAAIGQLARRTTTLALSTKGAKP